MPVRVEDGQHEGEVTLCQGSGGVQVPALEQPAGVVGLGGRGAGVRGACRAVGWGRMMSHGGFWRGWVLAYMQLAGFQGVGSLLAYAHRWLCSWVCCMDCGGVVAGAPLTLQLARHSGIQGESSRLSSMPKACSTYVVCGWIIQVWVGCRQGEDVRACDEKTANLSVITIVLCP